jgi:hypothetical protein
MNEPSVEFGWNVTTKNGKPITGSKLCAFNFEEDDNGILVPGTELYLETDPSGTHTFISLGDLEAGPFPVENIFVSLKVRDFLEPNGLKAEFGAIFTER